MIDLHSHLLPGVDDGSRSVEQSVQVLTAMAADGVRGICLTPHLVASRADQGIPEKYDAAYAALAIVAPEGIELFRGVELLLDRPLSPEAAADRRLTLAGSQYILVEFTRMISAHTAITALTQVRQLGLIPVVAHPERYAVCSPVEISRWRQAGAAMQVDANTLFQPTARGRRARALLEYGLADILAADNHGDSRSLALPSERLHEMGGEVQADLLLDRNPAAIVANEPLVPVPPLAVKTSLVSKLRSLLDSNG
ncbi:MAG: CpsB/CapC family capsule biosynthesis tyrosine phosphatase [Gemmatimonadota bacterium]